MNRKQEGFTLAELLIAVALIGVLVAVAIPVFNSQLEKSRQSTDLANLRGAYAAAKVAELSGEVAAYDKDGYSVEPVKIGDPSTIGTNTDWEKQYSAIAYVFLYDSDSGALYPWSQDNPTTCKSADDSSALVMTSTENGTVTTTMKARSDKIIVDVENLPGGNNGIIKYGFRKSAGAVSSGKNVYDGEALPGNSNAAWPDMKIVVQFTEDQGMWSLKRGAIRFENVGINNDIPKISLETITTPTPTP